MLDPNGFVARLAACLNSWGILLAETSEPDMYRLYYQRDSQESLAYLPNHRLAIYAKLDNGDGMSLLAVHIFEAFTVDAPTHLREIRLSGSRSVPRVCEVRDAG